jgi:hypothetical protein
MGDAKEGLCFAFYSEATIPDEARKRSRDVSLFLPFLNPSFLRLIVSADAELRFGSRVTFDREDLGTEARETSDAAASAEGEAGRSMQDLGQLRAAFDAWREFAVRRATGHTGRKWQKNEGGGHPLCPYIFKADGFKIL